MKKVQIEFDELPFSTLVENIKSLDPLLYS